MSYNRIQVRVQPNDTLLIFLLTVRLEEGKVLSKEELLQLISQGKVKFVEAKIINYEIISDLINCKGICDEKKYDYLVSQLELEGEVNE